MPSTDRCGSSARRRARKVSAAFASALRPATAAQTKTAIHTEKGPSPKDGVLAKHRWTEVAGVFHGKPAWGRIDDMEGNPGYPNNGWLLRHGFGFLNVSWPGLKPFTLEPGKPLTLKYRVTLGSGDAPR